MRNFYFFLNLLFSSDNFSLVYAACDDTGMHLIRITLVQRGYGGGINSVYM